MPGLVLALSVNASVFVEEGVPLPTNSYVAPDGTSFYVQPDGTSYYLQP